MKKIIKYPIILLAILSIGFAGLVFYKWDLVSTLLFASDLEGKVASIPSETVNKTLPSITKGKNDWLSWSNLNQDNSNHLKSKISDLSAITPLWEIDFLCQDKKSATWSCPIIQGNRLIITGRTQDKDIVFCLNSQTGKLIWKQELSADVSDSFGTGARATPSIDHDHVYTFSKSGVLVCWKLLDGEKVWSKNVAVDGGKEPKWGHSSSPLIIKDFIIVNAGGDARTVAYHKTTGKFLWKSGKGNAGYSAIRSMSIENKDIILSFHGLGLAGLELETGNIIWEHKWETPYFVNATSPVFINDKVFISSGYKTGSQLLKVNLKNVEVLWEQKKFASHHSDPFIINDHIYGYSGQSTQNRGKFICLDIKNGKEKWSSNDLGWGTCIKINENLLCSDIKGNLYLVNPNSNSLDLLTKKEHALGKIKGPVWTKPIVANGKLYLRFKQKLICFEL